MKYNLMCIYVFLNVNPIWCNGSQSSPKNDESPGRENDWPCVYAQPCQCDYNLKDVSCSNKGLTEIPAVAVVLEGAWKIDLSYNNITRVPDNVFSDIFVRALLVNDNQINEFSETAFNGSEFTIETLVLQNNRLNHTPSFIGNCTSLFELNIANNPIPYYNNDVFKGISGSLGSLTMGSPELRVWPDGMQYVRDLRSLVIYGLSLETLPNNSFNYLGSLYSLEISNTMLVALPESLNKLSNMDTLTLTDNEQLTEEGLTKEAFRGLTFLSNLKITNSNLRSFPPIFEKLSNLGSLTIDSNPISRIDDEIFPENGTWEQLTFFALNNTALNHFPSILSRLYTVIDLEITNSRIAEIKDTDFQGNKSRLTFLRLSGNPLTNFSDEAFRKYNYSRIREIKADNTQLTSIPRSVEYLPQLIQLDFTNTKIYCTCANLGWMKHWQKPKDSVGFDGMCLNSETSLETYVTNDVPKCP